MHARGIVFQCLINELVHCELVKVAAMLSARYWHFQEPVYAIGAEASCRFHRLHRKGETWCWSRS